jgi:tetratricopeptide (TPR) repeat protein
MDAVFSGQAGTLAFLQGAEAKVVRVDSVTTATNIAREGVGYLFQGCNDVVVAREVSEKDAKRRLETAWQNDRALRLLLISLDIEEESELRLEAADCLEELLATADAVAFIENQLYSNILPAEAGPQLLADKARWPLTAALVERFCKKQESIRRHREAWDSLPESLFEEGKANFEEQAINRGAFKLLASVDAQAKDPNIAILECHSVLRSLHDARTIVSEWTKDFKRAGIKPLIVPDDAEDEGTLEAGDIVSPYEEYQSALQQQEAILTKMRLGSVGAARKYTDELVRSQLKGSDPSFAAKSLCSLAQQAKELGIFSLQLEWAQRAVQIAPSDAWAHGQAADALIQFSRLDEALRELALAETYGDVRFAATGRARILRHQGRLDEALSAFRAVQEAFPEEPFAWMGSAETLREMWKSNEALKEYSAAIDRFPDQPTFRCGMAAVLSDLGRLTEALNVYDSPALRDQDVAANGKATVLRMMGRFSEALDAVNYAIELNPTDPVARCSKAEIYRVQGESSAALELYASVKKTSPNLPVSFAGYAESLRDMRRYPEAIAAYEEAIDLFPFDSYVANGYANIRKVNDEFQEALRLYEGNVKRFPYSLVAKSGRADLLKRLGQYDDALSAYDEILKISPTYVSAKNGKAAILVVRGDYSSALSLLSSQEPATRDDWIAWHIRGMAFVKGGELDRGIEYLEKGRAQTPFARERRYFERALSVARMRKGEFDKALEVLQQVGGLGLSNILRLHAYAGAGKMMGAARSTYRALSLKCPAELIDLKDAIAARYGLTADQQMHANDNWIFAREAEALLQAA